MAAEEWARFAMSAELCCRTGVAEPVPIENMLGVTLDLSRERVISESLQSGAKDLST